MAFPGTSIDGGSIAVKIMQWDPNAGQNGDMVHVAYAFTYWSDVDFKQYQWWAAIDNKQLQFPLDQHKTQFLSGTSPDDKWWDAVQPTSMKQATALIEQFLDDKSYTNGWNRNARFETSFHLWPPT